MSFLKICQAILAIQEVNYKASDLIYFHSCQFLKYLWAYQILGDLIYFHSCQFLKYLWVYQTLGYFHWSFIIFYSFLGIQEQFFEFCTELHCLAKKKIKMSTASKIFSKLDHIADVGNGGY